MSTNETQSDQVQLLLPVIWVLWPIDHMTMKRLLLVICLLIFYLDIACTLLGTCNRARWDWPQRPKFQNWDLHTWISIGNWILNLICFLQFFDLSTPFAVLLRFYFLPFLHGKNAQNRPENQQNWNLAKIGLKSDIFMK